MFRKILLPTDGSEYAMRAAEQVAAQSATTPGANVTIVVAIAPGDVEHSDLDSEVIRRQNERMRRHAADALKTVAALFERRGVPCTTKILEGDPASVVIAQEVESGNYDLVAMSSRGLGMQRTDSHYVGSVTEHMIRRVKIPVLVFPVHEDEDSRAR